jgi:hypothetical protein
MVENMIITPAENVRRMLKFACEILHDAFNKKIGEKNIFEDDKILRLRFNWQNLSFNKPLFPMAKFFFLRFSPPIQCSNQSLGYKYRFKEGEK